MRLAHEPCLPQLRQHHTRQTNKMGRAHDRMSPARMGGLTGGSRGRGAAHVRPGTGRKGGGAIRSDVWRSGGEETCQTRCLSTATNVICAGTRSLCSAPKRKPAMRPAHDDRCRDLQQSCAATGNPAAPRPEASDAIRRGR